MTMDRAGRPGPMPAERGFTQLGGVQPKAERG